VREGVDIALRLAPLADSAMKLRALGHSHRVLVAAPDYLASHGTPATPQQLAGHEGIRMPNVTGSEMLNLQGPDGMRHQVPFRGRFRANHGLAVREAVLAGRGIAAAHHWLVDDLINAGRLTPLLQGYILPSVPLNMLIVPERAGIARVRLLVDELVGQIGRLPGIRSNAA
jgi:DNA-binding transcriptional LysR family regulator